MAGNNGSQKMIEEGEKGNPIDRQKRLKREQLSLASRAHHSFLK